MKVSVISQGLTFAHPHFATTLFNDAHDTRVRDGRADVIGRIVDLLLKEEL
jgi:hypothetical protein